MPLQSHINSVIPREGVESLNAIKATRSWSGKYVIPREGVESIDGLHRIKAAKELVIPREGVESMLTSTDIPE